MIIDKNLIKKLQLIKQSSKLLSSLSVDIRNAILSDVKDLLASNIDLILHANKLDLNLAKQKKLSKAMLDRLVLDKDRIAALISSVDKIVKMPDPISVSINKWQANNINIDKVSVPLGVICVIYESRPNVTSDVVALAIKSGNACILRCGSEVVHSSQAILSCFHKALKNHQINNYDHMAYFLDNRDYNIIDQLLLAHEYIDLIVPRGGNKLMHKMLNTRSTVPILNHLSGLCHMYIHKDANNNMARKLVVNAKMRRTSICGALETLLVHKSQMQLLQDIINDLHNVGCVIYGDNKVYELDSAIEIATELDWQTEYLDSKLAIKIVADIDEAINHINHYGSNHTEAIVTADKVIADYFMNSINAAIVMWNTSNQFADGEQFGMGPEIGIATGKLHARGPVCLQQLTTFQYRVSSDGACRS